MSYASAGTWGAVSRSLLGLGATIAGNRRQKEEDERLKAERQRTRDIEDAKLQASLIEQGGGTGDAPTRAKVLGEAPPPSVDMLPPLRDPTQRSIVPSKPGAGIGIRSGGTAGIGLTAPPPPDRISAPAITAPVTVQESDPNYRAIGPKGFGYVKTPEAQDTEKELKQADISMGIGKAIHGIHPDVSEQAGMEGAFGALRAGGGIPAGMLTPREFPPVQPRAARMVQDKHGNWVGVDAVAGPTGVQGRVPVTPGETTPAQERAARISAAKELLTTINKIDSMSVNGVPIDTEERARRHTEAVQNSGFTSIGQAREIAAARATGGPMPSMSPTAAPARPAPTGGRGGPPPAVAAPAPPAPPAPGATETTAPGTSPDEQKQDKMNQRILDLAASPENLTNEQILERLKQEGLAP